MESAIMTKNPADINLGSADKASHLLHVGVSADISAQLKASGAKNTPMRERVSAPEMGESAKTAQVTASNFGFACAHNVP